jgi:ATP-dependent helicase/DNAse subunit B
MPDKYTAVWVSHSSMGDFLKCPRLYYLHNVYKDPATSRKMSIINPHMALGTVVHSVLEDLANYPVHERFNRDLRARFEEEWEKVTGLKGGFVHTDENHEHHESKFKMRGKEMINNVIKDPKFLTNKALTIKRPESKSKDDLPYFWLDENNNIILCGKVDWVEYLPESDSLHIIDFKTGKREEDEVSLQLPIYLLLGNALQKRKITKASYWYLESNKLVEKELPSAETAFHAVLEVALKVKQAREKGEFLCPKGEAGCMNCRPYEKILLWKQGKLDDGSVTPIGLGGFNQDMFVVR